MSETTYEKSGAGEIIAYRSWTAHAESGMLSGIAQKTMWPTHKPMSATCTNPHEGAGKGSRNAPAMFCGCGVYAFREEEGLRQCFDDFKRALGRVAIWGRIVVRTKGFRAEYAYPQVVYYGDASCKKATAERIAARYGIDAVPVPKSLAALYSKRKEIARHEQAARVQAAAQMMGGNMPSYIGNLYAALSSTPPAVVISSSGVAPNAPGYVTTWTTSPNYSNVGAAPMIARGLRPSGIYVPHNARDVMLEMGGVMPKQDLSADAWVGLCDAIEKGKL